MGSSLVVRCWLSSGGMVAVLSGAAAVWGQVPATDPPEAARSAMPAQAPVPATEPASPPSSATSSRSDDAIPPPPPPLDPPAVSEPPSRPSFLKTREEVERDQPNRRVPLTRRLDDERDPAPAGAAKPATALPKDFVVNATPWVDFSLTSFWMGDRSSNFLNVGVQVGGYFAERIRLTARLIAPLEEARDQYDNYDDISGSGNSYENVDSRSVAVLYGASIGLILSNSKSFLFAPGLVLWRTDENDYGTSGALSLPFEWTTHRHLRVGFEFALGYSFGGSVERSCVSSSSPTADCGRDSLTRPGGTAVLMQYAMGWALSPL